MRRDSRTPISEAGGDELHVFAARDVLAVERQVLLGQTPAEHDPVGEVLAFQRVHTEQVPGVEEPHGLVHPPACRAGACPGWVKKPSATAFSTASCCRPICRPVDAGVERAERGRHGCRRVAACLAARHAAQVGHDGVAGGVDELLGRHIAVALDVLQDHAADVSCHPGRRRRR